METPMDAEIERHAKQMTCLPVVSRGCCCTLRACCYVQGALSLIGGISVLGLESYIVNMMTQAMDSDRVDQETKDMLRVLRVAYSIIIFVVVVTLIMAVLFVVGIAKERPVLLMPYIVMYYVNLVLSCLMVVIAIAGFVSPVDILFYLISIALVCYCLVCANSLRVRMIAATLVSASAASPGKMPYRV